MTKAVYFDVWEDDKQYKLCVVGDDGYLYIADIYNPYPNITKEKFNFNKIDIVKINLEIDRVKFGCMKVIAPPQAHPHQHTYNYQIYIALQTSDTTTKKMKSTLYKFYSHYDSETNSIKWEYEIAGIPNTILCIEYDNKSKLYLGGIDGIIKIDIADINQQSIVKIGVKDPVLTITSILYNYIIAGTELGLLISTDLGDTFKAYYPQTTNEKLLAGGVGKISHFITADEESQLIVYLFGTYGISRAVVSSDKAPVWGEPFNKDKLDMYSYTAYLDNKDLAGALYLDEDLAGNQLVNLFAMDPYISTNIEFGSNIGILNTYKTPLDIKTDKIHMGKIFAEDPYFHINQYNMRSHPKMLILNISHRVFALSSERELSVFALQDTKWTEIELPN